MHNWSQYNERLVRRGEILISDDVIKSWDKELAEMNNKKQGRKFLFPESFHETGRICASIFWAAIPPDRRSS
jgi:hypothetical protein